MAGTLLTHKGCGGVVALDASKLCRLVAPSFIVSPSGINHFTMDIILKPVADTPGWICCKCQEEFVGENLKVRVSARCSICGEQEDVGDMFMHQSITCVCSSCTKEFKDHFTTPGHTPHKIMEYINVFGLTKPFKVSSFYKLLTLPVKL